jgi:hypothetical protein
MPPKNFVGSIHVVHDDGNVLEPVIVALGVAWDGRTFLAQVFRQGDVFGSQPQLGSSSLGPGQSQQIVCRASRGGGFRDELKWQDLREELQLPV